MTKENDPIIKNRIKTIGKFLSKYLKEGHKNTSEISDNRKVTKSPNIFKKINKYETNNSNYIRASILRELLSKQIN